MEDRIKALEVEIAYLRKLIEDFVKNRPIEFHYHYYNDFLGYPEDYETNQEEM